MKEQTWPRSLDINGVKYEHHCLPLQRAFTSLTEWICVCGRVWKRNNKGWSHYEDLTGVANALADQGR